MENAGRTIAEAVKSRFGNFEKRPVFVFSGKGNNGGDGFVAARYLFNMGADVSVFYMGQPEKFSAISFTNYQILFKMDISVQALEKNGIPDLPHEGGSIIVDAIFGSGIKGQIEGTAKDVIQRINDTKGFVVSADIPSGLNPDTGDISGIAVKADMTVSFGFDKCGFYFKESRRYCGEIKVADIGFPMFFYNDSL
jgi:ADP-dependent NAD(P)H-hydrate dehydratase / NAD(P)H-hydrate epimerase